MKKKLSNLFVFYSICILIYLTACTKNENYELKGRIVDETGKAVGDVVVTTVEYPDYTVTNSAGEYLLNVNLPFRLSTPANRTDLAMVTIKTVKSKYTVTFSTPLYIYVNTNNFIPDIIIYKDNDNDGMPDSWETKYSVNKDSNVILNVNDPMDANYDPDGDGYPNIIEYKYGTDPDNSESKPIIPDAQ